MKNGKILVIGDIMLDIYQSGRVNRICPEAPVPIILVDDDKRREALGGAANVAVNLAAIGTDVSVMAVVGADNAGALVEKMLCGSGIHTQHLLCANGRVTTSKLRYIGQNHQQVLRVDREDVSDIPLVKWEPVIKSLEQEIDEYSLILLSDYGKGVVTAELAGYVINLAKKHDIRVLVDVKGENWEKYKGAWLLKPNRNELNLLTDKPVDTVDEAGVAAVDLCRKAECRYILATLGAEGMLLADRHGICKTLKSTGREVYDVTGAGDTVLAYLAAEMVCGKTIEEAIESANYAAGIQVSKVGTGIVYPYEVRNAQRQGERCGQEKILRGNKKSIADFFAAERMGRKIVFTNGCFDILHAGHVEYLQKAREMGDCLVVGVNTDHSVRRLKGLERPINQLSDRLKVLAGLEFVDYVIAFDDDTPLELIEAVKPDILVKGGDYQISQIVGADFVRKRGGSVFTIPVVEGKSTTGIVEKCKGGRV